MFDANELITSVQIENMSLIEKIKILDLNYLLPSEQLDRTSTSKLDNMLNVQKSTSSKIELGFDESVSTFVVHSPKFVSATSISTPKVKVLRKRF